MPRDKKKDDGEIPIPQWVVTYGDMMSLLLTFFVLLLSFSTISEQDFNKAILSLQGAFSVLPEQGAIINPVPRQPRKETKTIENIARRIRRKMQIVGRQNQITLTYDAKGGLKITLPDALLFESGGAQLQQQAYEIIDDLAQLLSTIPDSFIEVRGHTDNRPIETTSAFRDNMGLSHARADVVARRLQRIGNIPWDQFEIVAAGSGQPVATNDTPEGRAANRRVDIHVRGVFNQSTMVELKSELGEGEFNVAPEVLDPGTTP